TCSTCSNLANEIKVIENRAFSASKKLALGTLSHAQLVKKLQQRTTALNVLKLESLNHSRKIDTQARKLDAYREFHDLAACQDIPAISRLLRNAKRQNWSISMLNQKARDALAGNYHPYSYSDYEKDIAILTYELGGGATLYALNHATTSLPSRHCISSLRQEINFHISAGEPKIKDILANIETAFKDVRPNHYKTGVTLSLDETSTEQRLIYLPETDEVAGLCHHAKDLGSLKIGDDMKVVSGIARAVRVTKHVHVAHEATVAAFSRHDPEHYGARPALIMPTCKKDQDSYDAALEIRILQEAWRISSYGARLHGDLWSIASDGDPRRRKALYFLCMVRELKESDPLYMFLGHLAGLNLLTGPDFVTAAFDWKHDFKRLVTTLLSTQGMLIDDIEIGRSLLADYIERLEGHDFSDTNLWALFNHDDKQDVPRAVTLLSLIADLRDLDTDDYDPSELNTYRALELLGEMVGGLIEPFLSVHFSLSEQVIHLVKFSHIMFALFQKHGNSFIPSQLFGDLQCMFKDAIFTVARMKLLNPDHKVFLCLLGDDALEALFGRVRMLGGHNPNVDVDQLRHSLGSAIRLDEIFSRYPHLERKPRRLNLERTRSADHFSPRHWTGDLSAGSCDLDVCWRKGAEIATQCLRRAGYNVDFNKIFAKPGVDLMRPHAEKPYPGLSTEVDRSIEFFGESETETSNPHSDSLPTQKIWSFDIMAALAKEEHETAIAQSKPPHSVWMKVFEDSDLLSHKATILRHEMNPSFDIDQAASRARLARVKYFSSQRPDWDRSISNIVNKSGDNAFCVDHLFATLIAIQDSHVSLAILKCTSIRTAKGSVFSVPFDEIALPNSRFELSGQVLSLVPGYNSDNELVWDWQDTFIEFQSGQRGRKKKSTRSVVHTRNLRITANGCIVQPLRPSELKSVPFEELSPTVKFLLRGGDHNTWRFTDADLSQLQMRLSERAQDDAVRVKIPVSFPVQLGNFPYTAMISTDKIIRHMVTSIAAPTSQKKHQLCTVCNKNIETSLLQNHMGQHILHQRRGLLSESQDLQ
ncbi:hypothetical protein H0H81_003920, partial [Sphagnurus paluster]